MKYLKQFMIIAAVTCVSEVLNYLIPFKVPASIYGLVIMFILLCTHIVKLDQVQETADFLLNIMPIMFVPPAVSIMVTWGLVADSFVIMLIICVVTTIIVMAVTGLVTQLIIRIQKRGGKHE